LTVEMARASIVELAVRVGKSVRPEKFSRGALRTTNSGCAGFFAASTTCTRSSPCTKSGLVRSIRTGLSSRYVPGCRKKACFCAARMATRSAEPSPGAIEPSKSA
jgi:hypothetical protein